VIFNSYSHLKDKHAFLSPSKYHWINYTDDKLERVFAASMMAARGTQLHDLAADLIRLGVPLRSTKATLNMYVNDALGFKMHPEQTLFYSENCFGHADAIGFRRNKLRIHDLKTGASPTSEHQLEVYAAIFCLEYDFRPAEIDMDLRIYQNNDIQIWTPDNSDLVDSVTHIMDRIVSFDKRLKALRMEAQS
jgi:hypothetical protein